MTTNLFTEADREVLSKSMGREADDDLLNRLLASAMEQAKGRYREQLRVYPELLSAHAHRFAVYERDLSEWEGKAKAFDQRARRYEAELEQWQARPSRADFLQPSPPVDPGPRPEPPEAPAEPVEPTAESAVANLMDEQRAAVARAELETKADIVPDFGVERAEIVNEAYDLVMRKLSAQQRESEALPSPVADDTHKFPAPDERLSDWDVVGATPAWLDGDEYAREGEDMNERIRRLTSEFRARVNLLNNFLLDASITPEQEAELADKQAKYHELAELGDRS